MCRELLQNNKQSIVGQLLTEGVKIGQAFSNNTEHNISFLQPTTQPIMISLLGSVLLGCNPLTATKTETKGILPALWPEEFSSKDPLFRLLDSPEHKRDL